MDLHNYIIKNQKTHIIFDFDDTIFSMGKGGMLAYKGVCNIVTKVDKSLVNEFENSPKQIYNLSNKAIMLYGKTIKKELLSFFNQFESELLDTEKRNNQMINFIKDNHNKYDFSIWSSNTLKLLNHVLKKYNLTSCFSNIIGRDSVDLAKPYPDGFYKIINSSKFIRKDYLMVGDSSGDEQAAINSGIDFFKIDKDLVNWK